MAQPRMSIGSWAFSFGPFESDPWSFQRVLQYTADAGFDGIEINGFKPHPDPESYDTPAKCRQLMDEIGGYGLGVSGYAPSFADTPPSEVAEHEYIREMTKSVQLCERCSIGALRVDTASPPSELATGEYEERFSRLANTWHSAAEICEKSGVLLVWEFEPGFWLNKPSEVLRLYDAVGHKNFKILFDTSHAYMGAVVCARHTGAPEKLAGGVREYAEKLGNAIGHLHLIDSDGSLHDDETSTHAPFGTGNIDFTKSLEPIRDVIAEFQWWTADFCFWPGTEEAARMAPAAMKRIAAEVL